MQRIREAWRGGLVGKVIIISAALGIFVVTCCVLLLAIGLLGRPRQQTATGTVSTTASSIQATEGSTPATQPTHPPLPTDIPAPMPTIGPTDTPAPTVTPEPTVAPSPTPLPAEVVRAAVEQVLGRSNRNVERVVTAALDPDVENPPIYIRWSINDNVTEGFIKSSAQTDIRDILKAIHDSGVQYGQITTDGLFPLVDSFGNSKETIVVHAVYKRETVDKINWDNFLRANVYTIADELEVHPTFQP